MRDTVGLDLANVAVIGYAARLPGAEDIGEVWDSLINGRCQISEIPSSRWGLGQYYDPRPDAPGKSYARHAGLVSDIFDFDAGYFGLSPREAEQMDPQQRLLLETAARAFDHAGIDPVKLDKERTGVFVGAASSDHSTTCLLDPSVIDAQFMLGNTLSIISNRLSYIWDIRGPSYTVDTACSSGLFALDHARAAIVSGEIDTAIVGSVNVLLSPMPFVGFSKASMLSPTGLCQAFSKNADGYVRAEGAVVFILRSEDLARTSHDRIRSFVAATGTNSDGRTPGIAMPSSQRQYELLEHVKHRFDISPNDLAFIEAHGTGTAVGDPEEARAIGRAYGQLRDAPLPIGSAKTNFGHLEPAAGLVGLLKAQLSLEHGILPASLHSDELNPHIPFADLGLDVAQEARPLPESARPWCAAVNSFGFGGANAHAVLRQAPTAPKPEVAFPRALLLSAASQASLAGLAGSWRDRTKEAALDLALAAVNANTRLARHRHRLCVPATSAEEVAAALELWLAGEKGHDVVQGVAGQTPGKVGFVFSGNGSQWAGMGRYMLLNDAIFRDSFGETSEIAVRLGAASLLDLIMSTDLDVRLERATVAQPLLLAIQIAMVDALAAVGVKPAAVLGHSAGEVAAAYAAGAITREQAVQIIVARSQTLDQLFEAGGMVALACDQDRALAIISEAGLDVDIAAENSANSLTVSGKSDDLSHLMKLCRKKRIAGRRLQIEYPYHSRMTEPLRARLIDELSAIQGAKTQVDYYSGCRGARVRGDVLNTNYWWENARNMVRFREGVEAMARDGVSVFVEISPKSVLQSYVRDSLDEVGLHGTVLGSLEEANADQIDAPGIALNIVAHGGRIDEETLLAPPVPFAGDLPVYPFDRKTYRLASSQKLDLFAQEAQHPLLGGRLRADFNIWTSDLSLGRLPWLGDHVVNGHVLLPATAIIEMLISAAAEYWGEEAVELRDLEILRPIQLPERHTVPVRVVLDPVARRLTLESRIGEEWVWIAGASHFKTEAKQHEKLQLAEGAAHASLYGTLSDVGLDYGPAFARAEHVSLEGEVVDVKLSGPRINLVGMNLDPTATDAALHAALLFVEPFMGDGQRTFVPGRIGRIRWFGQGEIVGARLHLRSASPDGICLDVTYVDEGGNLIAQIRELRLRPLPAVGARRNAFWIERTVPITASEPAEADLPGVFGACDAEALPTDLEVLRDTIGSRLAWDVVMASRQGDMYDRRYDVALSSLEAMEVLEGGQDVAAATSGECPWPDVPTLLNLLIDTHPDASDEIEATLHGMVSDRRNEGVGMQRLRSAALDLLDDPDLGFRRVLLVGRADPAVFQRLLAKCEFLVFAAESNERAEALRVSLAGSDRCLITEIGDLDASAGFDLILGIGTAEVLSARHQKGLAELGRDGTRLLLVDQAVDLFEVMTGRYGASSSIDNLDASLATIRVAGERVAWRGASHITIFSARLKARRAVPEGSAAVYGDGAFADALRAIGQDDAASDIAIIALDRGTDLVATMLAQSEAFRALPADAKTIWVVQNGLDARGALQGWRRVLANEMRRDIRCMSVAEGMDPGDVLRLAQTSHEHEIVLTPEGARGSRLVPAEIDGFRPGPGRRATLTLESQGRIASLRWTGQPRLAPAADEIEVAVAATALNYRDVMWAQGLLPGDLLEGGFAGPSLGMECAGTVTRVGTGAPFKPGDRVLAFAPNAFSSHVTVSASAAVPVPDEFDLVLAASLPTIFVTAEYALTDLARLCPGEWCLIHGAAGGVGLAAIQVAKRAGARIIATAGSPAKRALVRALGVEHVCNSRGLEFVDFVEEVTAGRGVDVVLNSLAGEAMEQGLGCLAPFGRFIELGKRDFVANTAIGLRAMKNNISYFGVDADQLLRLKPGTVAEVMRRIVHAFAAGDYRFTPMTVYPPEMAVEAFRTMQRSAHIGKLLVAPPKAPGDAEAAPEVGADDLSGSWLISGGTRGFGLATARWLAGRGASTLWLASRNGTLEESDRTALEALGVRVFVRAVDLTDTQATEALIAEIGDDEAGLAGIVNGAAIFDDALFAETDGARFEPVIRAKLDTARALDRASRALPIRHFWLYSSVACRFGNIGQAAYVAANMELEAMAAARASEGLPGLAVAWGPIGDVGYLDRSAEVRAVIERKLGGTMHSGEALGLLGKALPAAQAGSTLTIAPVSWSDLKNDLPVLSEPLFEFLDLRSEQGSVDDAIDRARGASSPAIRSPW